MLHNLLVVICFLIILPSNAFSKDIQFHFDKRYDFYSDSEHLGVKGGKRYFYKHSTFFKKALKDENFEASNYYLQCQTGVESQLIVKLEPSFFYNPLMQIMYANLKYYVYGPDKKLLQSEKLSLEKITYFPARSDIQLKDIYVEFLNQIESNLSGINVNGILDGDFCKSI